MHRSQLQDKGTNDADRKGGDDDAEHRAKRRGKGGHVEYRLDGSLPDDAAGASAGRFELFVVSFAGKKTGQESRDVIGRDASTWIPDENVHIVPDGGTRGACAKSSSLPPLSMTGWTCCKRSAPTRPRRKRWSSSTLTTRGAAKQISPAVQGIRGALDRVVHSWAELALALKDIDVGASKTTTGSSGTGATAPEPPLFSLDQLPSLGKPRKP